MYAPRWKVGRETISIRSRNVPTSGASEPESEALVFDPGVRESPASGSGSSTPAPPPTGPVVLLPTLNEEAGLVATFGDLPIADLTKAGFAPTVVVVDGHSTDRTREVARGMGLTVLDQEGTGKGDAVRTGLRWAREHGAPFVIVVDADYTYDARAIVPMCSLLDAGTDLVIGVRRPDRHTVTTVRGIVHRVGNATLNLVAASLTRSPILDISSGLWGLRSDAIERLALQSDGFDIESELYVKAFRHGLTISQVPVEYRDRVGTAKLHAMRDGARILLAILRHSSSRLLPRPIPMGLRPFDSHRFLARSLEAIVFALHRDYVVLVTPNASARLANECRRRLESARVRTDVVTAPAAWAPGGVAAVPVSPEGPSPRGGPRLPVFVTFASPHGVADDGFGRPLAFVGIPDGLLCLYAPTPAPGAPPAEDPGAGAYSRRAARRRLARPAALIRAVIQSTLTHADLPILMANAAAASIRLVPVRRARSAFTSLARPAPAPAFPPSRLSLGGRDLS
ncbi:MAG TPA: glycosyltransferase family 2 protein [Thermoplasmata archaeon]|nr:glycosyltransferase family 2 protein [Thermoplasmata archaeon]